ncbi:MAG: DUF2267 domain-containing protein [Chloroflexota bacterium]
MDYHTFLGKVQNQARLPTTQAAVTATRATLETLAKRLHDGGTENLAAQLPEELGLYLKQAEPSVAFGLGEFFNQVGQREGVDLPDAVHHSRVVVAVLAEAVTAGEMQKIRAQLPDEYDPLFESGSEGSL